MGTGLIPVAHHIKDTDVLGANSMLCFKMNQCGRRAAVWESVMKSPGVFSILYLF